MKQIRNLKFVIRNCQAGMTYVELIVVLSIFSMMTSVVMFNYGDFQAKVDIKNLASDIALKIVEAQKSSLSGNLSTRVPTVSPWKPAYGVRFNVNSIANSKQFVFFEDLNNSNTFNATEVSDTISITKGNYISQLKVFGVGCPETSPNLAIIFKRPSSSAMFASNNPALSCTSISYAQITVTSPKGATDFIKVYPSGRIQVD